MVEKHYVTDQIVLTIGYDIENLKNSKIRDNYNGKITTDHYGREVPKSSHGTIRIDHKTSSTKTITEAVIKIYDSIINPLLLVRRVNIAVYNLSNEDEVKDNVIYKQYDLFSNIEEEVAKKNKELENEKSERKIQNVIINLKHKYGKNSILKGMNLEDGGTTIERNKQVGGHRG